MNKCNCKIEHEAEIEGINVLISFDSDCKYFDYVYVTVKVSTPSFKIYVNYEKIFSKALQGEMYYSYFNTTRTNNVLSGYSFAVKKGTFILKDYLKVTE